MITTAQKSNVLYFGDCLDVMREYIKDESVDLVYLDPPFNSKRIYNAFIGGAQWIAFHDTWRWHEAIDDFDEVVRDQSFAQTLEGLRRILGEGSKLAYLSYMANRLRECYRVLKSTGSIYLHCDPTMSHYLKILMDGIFEERNFRNEIVWRIGWVSGYKSQKKGWIRNHDILLYYLKSPKATSYFNKEYILYTHDYVRRDGKRPTGKGIAIEDTWNCSSADILDSMMIKSFSTEKLGYPTQKPLALLERIIRASSHEGDVVLDPFCGCGTTIHAAQNLGRYWIGIDVCVNACKVIEERIRGHFDSLWSDVRFIGLPMDIEQARRLAGMDKFHFETWAASLVDGMEANKKQRRDRGIDGRGRIGMKRGEYIDVVSQVKGGHAEPKDIQAFNGARQQVEADMGIFTCFEEKVTVGMRDAAACTGRFKGVPVIQIYTIEDFFAGRKPMIPRV